MFKLITNWIKANPIKLLIGIAFIALCCIVFQKCDRTPNKEVETVYIDNPQTKREAQYWRDSAINLMQTIGKLKQDKKESDKVLDRANTEMKKLIVNYRQAKADKDTVLVIANCDSIVNENQHLTDLVSDYQLNMDELVMQYDAAVQAADSAAIKQTQLASELRAANKDLTGKYNGLVSDYNKLNRKAKNRKGLNRMLAGAAIVLGGIVLLK